MAHNIQCLYGMNVSGGIYTMAAMDLKFGMIILPSSCYTCRELRAPPISGVGGVSEHINRIRKSLFYAVYATLCRLPHLSGQEAYCNMDL